MGLARIAIAVLAVTLALGLLILGGVSLWGALTKDAGKNAASPGPVPSGGVSSTAASRHSSMAPSRSGGTGVNGANTVVIRCLALQCPVFVAGPGPTDVQFNGKLGRNEERQFSETRLTVSVGDAGATTVIINGRQQPRGHRGQQKIYRIPAQR